MQSLGCELRAAAYGWQFKATRAVHRTQGTPSFPLRQSVVAQPNSGLEQRIVQSLRGAAQSATQDNTQSPQDSTTLATGDNAVLDSETTAGDDFFGVKELVSEVKGGTIGSRGEFLTVAQLLVGLFVIFPPFSILGVIQGLGLMSMVLGGIFFVYGLVSLARNFSPFPEPRQSHSLVTDGAFGLVRHPMYGGLVVGALGLAAITGSETRLLAAMVFTFIVDYKASVEEKALRLRYGEKYEQYMEATPYRMIPSVY